MADHPPAGISFTLILFLIGTIDAASRTGTAPYLWSASLHPSSSSQHHHSKSHQNGGESLSMQGSPADLMATTSAAGGSISPVMSIAAAPILFNGPSPPTSWNQPSTGGHAGTPMWSSFGQSSATCVDIPSNLTLCHGIGYTKMRLPNLLNHDSLQEVSQQSMSWVPLYQINCHPDTQLFLCSLFSPVCLDHPIPPCRSLCESVRNSCAKIMTNYGYPWPDIVSCEQFPVDNDMCIQAQSEVAKSKATTQMTPQHHHRRKPTMTGLDSDHHHHQPGDRKKPNNGSHGKKRKHHQRSEAQQPAEFFNHDQMMVSEPLRDRMMIDQAFNSQPAESQVIAEHHQAPKDPLYHQVVDNFCKSSWVLKARLATVNRPVLGPANRHVVKLRNYQPLEGGANFPPFQRHESMALILVPAVEEENGNLTQALVVGADRSRRASEGINNRRRYLIMGNTINDENLATFAMPWPHKSGPFRKALKAIKQGHTNCKSESTPQPTTTGYDTTLAETTSPPRVKGNRGQKRNRNGHQRKSSRSSS